MESINIFNLIIVDQSGSMMSIYDMALSSLNETIQTIRKNQMEHPDIKQHVSIATFSGDGLEGVNLVRDRVPVTKIEEMTRKDYEPNGCTPLYDAIGKSVSYLQKHVTDNDKVLVTIITDGFENSSREYSVTSVRSIIELLRTKGWTFGFIGANQDSVLTAKELGIKNALDFSCTIEGTAVMSRKMAASNKKFTEAIHFSRASKSQKTASDMDNLYDSD